MTSRGAYSLSQTPWGAAALGSRCWGKHTGVCCGKEQYLRRISGPTWSWLAHVKMQHNSVFVAVALSCRWLMRNNDGSLTEAGTRPLHNIVVLTVWRAPPSLAFGWEQQPFTLSGRVLKTDPLPRTILAILKGLSKAFSAIISIVVLPHCLYNTARSGSGADNKRGSWVFQGEDYQASYRGRHATAHTASCLIKAALSWEKNIAREIMH